MPEADLALLHELIDAAFVRAVAIESSAAMRLRNTRIRCGSCTKGGQLNCSGPPCGLTLAEAEKLKQAQAGGAQ